MDSEKLFYTYFAKLKLLRYREIGVEESETGMKLIERKPYLQKLIDVMGAPDIKVITGVRRAGKSKLLEAFKAYIKSSDHKANIIQANFNFAEYEMLMEYYALN